MAYKHTPRDQQYSSLTRSAILLVDNSVAVALYSIKAATTEKTNSHQKNLKISNMTMQCAYL